MTTTRMARATRSILSALAADPVLASDIRYEVMHYSDNIYGRQLALYQELWAAYGWELGYAIAYANLPLVLDALYEMA